MSSSSPGPAGWDRFDPAELPAIDRYKLLIGGVVPRPIAFVSTCDQMDRLNLAPFSFFAGVGSNPMTVLFCPASNADGSEKDTLRNAKPASEGGLGEFVINIAPESIARQLAACAEPLPYGQSEFDFSSLTPIQSDKVRPPRVAQARISFECITRQVIRTNPGAPAAGNIVVGEVVMVHAAPGLVNERHHVDPEQLNAFGRMGGLSYCRTADRFDLPMGAAALNGKSPQQGPRTQRATGGAC